MFLATVSITNGSEIKNSTEQMAGKPLLKLSMCGKRSGEAFSRPVCLQKIKGGYWWQHPSNLFMVKSAEVYMITPLGKVELVAAVG